MRVLFSFLPTVMVSGRRRFRRDSRRIIVWTESNSLSVWLRHRVDRQQKTTRQHGDDQFH